MGVNPIAIVRPDAWDVPLFLHVLGALVLVGALTLTAAFLFAAWRGGSTASLRLGLRSLTLGVIPAWIVLRFSAEWIAEKEGFNEVDDPPSWLNIGYIASEGGLLLIIIAGVLGWRAYRKLRDGQGEPGTTTRVAATLLTIVLVLSVVAIWAMTTKPA